MKIEKGQQGYVNSRKKRYGIAAIVEFAIVAAILIIGYLLTGSRKNYYTIAAIVGCLPASKMLVEYIVLARYKSFDKEKYEEILNKAGLLVQAYDMVLTSKERVMPLDAVVIYGNTVCGYTSFQKADVDQTASYIKKILEDNNFPKMTVKVFLDYNAFLSRAEGMNNIAAVENEKTMETEEAMKKILLISSM